MQQGRDMSRNKLRRVSRRTVFKNLALSTLIVLAAACASVEKFDPRWIPQDSGTSESLRGVCAVSRDVAWASGGGGTFLRTLDGGETWECGFVPGAKDLDFRDVHAMDDRTALLLSTGEPAKIFKTHDGGKRWTEQYADDRPGVFFDGMAFFDAKRGIAFSDPIQGSFLLIRTEDGGETWREVPRGSIPPPLPGEAGFAASGTCVCVQGESLAWFATGGTAARVFRSVDKGATWTAVNAPVLSGTPSRGIFSIAFKDARSGVIVGGDYKDPQGKDHNAAWTFDGGETWYPVERSQPKGYRSCVAYFRNGPAFVFITAGPSGSDYSLDLGRTWVNFDRTGFHSLSFAGPCGWAVGADGRIAKLEF